MCESFLRGFVCCGCNSSGVKCWLGGWIGAECVRNRSSRLADGGHHVPISSMVSFCRRICLLLLFLIPFLLPAQRRTLENHFPDIPYKGRLYFYWGYNRAIFSRSDI